MGNVNINNLHSLPQIFSTVAIYIFIDNFRITYTTRSTCNRKHIVFVNSQILKQVSLTQFVTATSNLTGVSKFIVFLVCWYNIRPYFHTARYTEIRKCISPRKLIARLNNILMKYSNSFDEML